MRQTTVMPYVISDECINCGLCKEQCAVCAVRNGVDKMEIEENECTKCGTCAGTCPAKAIRFRE